MPDTPAFSAESELDVLLANPYWGALATEQAGLAIGGQLARRFPPEVIPFGGIAEGTSIALDELYALLQPGESIYLTSKAPLLHAGLRQVLELPGLQMVHPLEAPLPTPDPAVTVKDLDEATAPEMIKLKAIAFPGYFGPRAAGLGAFCGVRAADGTLIAMCGERLMLPGMRELSALCTHPEHLGKGYAAALLLHLLRKHRSEGLRSFLHVTAANARAIALYQRLGFITTRPLTWRKLLRVL